MKKIYRLFTALMLSLSLCTAMASGVLAASEKEAESDKAKATAVKPDEVISYFDCNTEYKYTDNVYCVMVVTDDCEGAATDDALYLTLTGQNGVSTLPINVNNPLGCDMLEFRSYYGYNKGLEKWDAHSESCRDGSYNLYIIRSPEDLTTKITEITLMTTPNTWFAEGSWSIHSVYAYKLIGKMSESEFSSYKAFQGDPEFDFSISQYALLNGYTLDAASCEGGWDKVSVSLSKLPTDARFIEETFCDLGYTGFPSTGSMRKTSYVITIFTIICAGITVAFSLCVLLYRWVVQKRKLQDFSLFKRLKSDNEPRRRYFK